MAESMTIKVQTQGYQASVAHPEAQHDEVHVTTFWGGPDRGRMVQVTIGDQYVCMMAASAEAVGQAIEFAARNGVAAAPQFFRD